MSLDFQLIRTQPVVVFQSNTTHNLAKMAIESGLYGALWEPHETKFQKARDIIPILKQGIKILESDPSRFRKFNSPNGWGTYEQFVQFVKEVLSACEEYPDADMEVDR